MSIVKQEYFGSISVLTGLEVFKDDGSLKIDMIQDQLEGVLTLAINNHAKWHALYNKVATNETIKNIKSKDKWDFNISSKFGMEGYLSLIDSFRLLLEQIQNPPYPDDDTSKDEGYLFALLTRGLYVANVLMLHIYELEQQRQTQPAVRLLSVGNLQAGKQKINLKRQELKQQYPKSIAGAVSFINDNYIKWWKQWVAYKKNSTDVTKKYYQLIPIHFRNWFECISSNTDKTYAQLKNGKFVSSNAMNKGNKTLNYYWENHKNNTGNKFIENFIK